MTTSTGKHQVSFGELRRALQQVPPMTHVTADFSDETHLNPTCIFVPLQEDPKTFRIETSNIMVSASGVLN